MAPMTTDLLPDEVQYGFVYGKTLLAIGDTTDDDDRFPDGVAAKGVVRFTPKVTILRTESDPATIIKQRIECRIHQGKDEPDDPDPSKTGLLIDTAGHVGNVALIIGQYDVSYHLEGGASVPSFTIDVNAEHTSVAPLVLALAAPIVPAPSVKFVVNEQVYTDTLAARDEAFLARDQADLYRDQAAGFRDQASQSMIMATQQAQRAETARDETLAHGITIDTTVGTRVYVGGVRIYAETPWCDVTHLASGIYESGTLHMRRVNDTVHLRLIGVTLGTGSTGEGRIMDPLPRGFRTTTSSREGAQVGLTTAISNVQQLIVWESVVSWVYQIASGAFSQNRPTRPLQGALAWATPATEWPTALPGTPI